MYSCKVSSVIQWRDVSKLSLYISQGLRINSVLNDLLGLTMLHQAAYFGNIEILKYLVKKGEDVHSKDHSSYTAIHYACLYRHFETVKYLIELGVNPHILDNCGRTAFDLACQNNYPEIVEYLAQFKL